MHEATERSPSFAWAWASLGMLGILQGRDMELASRHADVALRLNPRDPLAFRNYITKSRAPELAGRHEEAAEFARMGLKLRPDLAILHVILIRNLVLGGRMEEAREAARRLLDWLPNFSAREFGDHHKNFRGIAWDPEAFTQELISAGLPE